jgi:CRP-like cAMP-binding protein
MPAELSSQARKLYDVIVRQSQHGPIHPKAPGTTSPAEVLEACGLDVGEFYRLLDTLRDAGLIEYTDTYPQEEIRLKESA